MCCIAQFIVKYVLFFANLVFLLAGIVFIGIGVAVLLQLRDLYEVVPGVVNVVPITIIVLGCIIFLIAFFGCCGAIKQNCCMLTTYVICMGVLVAVKIWLTVFIFTNLNSLGSLVSEWLTKAFALSSREPFHVLERAFNCCGPDGPFSYAFVNPPVIPNSCCAAGSGCTIINSYPGCIGIFSDYLDTFGSAIGGLILTIIAVEVVAAIFGLFLACTGNNSKGRTY